MSDSSNDLCELRSASPLLDTSRGRKSVTLLDRLPLDILKEILRFARIPDLVAFTQTCRYLHDLASDVSIQYAIEAYLAGAKELTDDNIANVDALTKTTLSERLSIIRRRENAWRTFQLAPWQRIDVPCIASEFHGLSGGVLEIGVASAAEDGSTAALKYAVLPAVLEPQNIVWKHLDLGVTLYSTAISLHENDLMAAVTFSPVPNQFLMIVNIHLIQISTSGAHPLATRSCLAGPEFPNHLVPEVRSKILGNYIALVVSFFGRGGDVPDRFLVFDWISGQLVLDHRAPESGVYRGVAFLSPTMVVITDTSGDGALGLWEIAPSPQHIGDLSLPPTGYNYDMCDIHDEPGLTLSHSPSTPYPSMCYDSQQALITFLAFLGTNNKAIFVSRRSKLLDAAEQLRALGVGADEEPPSLDYSEWGPHATRWIPANHLATDSSMRHGGQRLVVTGQGPPDEGSPIIVYDFNPLHVRAWAGDASDLDTSNDEDSSISKSLSSLPLSPPLFVKTRPQSVPSENLPFSEPLVDELPYITYESRQFFDFGAIWTDGERIAGVKMNERYQVASLDIIHLG